MNKTAKWIVGVVVVVLIVWGIVAGSHKNAQTDQSASATQSGPIKIGVIAPLTGTASVYGTDAQGAIMTALDEINKSGGVNGRKIEAVVEDGKCDPKVAVNAWSKLVDVDGVHTVFGGHCSSESAAIGPLTAPAKVLALADMTSAQNIPQEGEWLFRNSPNNVLVAAKTASYMVGRGYKNIAIITELTDFAKSYSDIFKKSVADAGGTITFDESVAPGTTDFNSVLAKLRTAKYDAVLLSTQGPDTMGVIAKQMKTLGIDRPTAFNAAFSSKKFLDSSGGYMPATHIIVNSYTDPAAQRTKAFTDAFKAVNGRDVVFNLYYVAATYDMVYRYRDALLACNGNDADTECLRNVFKNATVESGAAGDNIPIVSTYTPKSPVMPLGIVDIVNGKDVVSPMK